MLNKREFISFIIKILIAVCATVGVTLTCVASGARNLLFFTLQSNIFIAICSIIGAVLILLQAKNKKDYFKKWMYVVKLVATVSITLTGLMFCCVLAPTMEGDWVWSIMNIFTHVVVPVLAVVDFFVFDYVAKYKYTDAIWTITAPLYYLAFSLCGYFLNWDFGYGNNYPYFFLNWDSPCGVFGFSTESPYMAPNYWGILIVGFVIAVGCLYIFLAKKLRTKK